MNATPLWLFGKSGNAPGLTLMSNEALQLKPGKKLLQNTPTDYVEKSRDAEN